MRGLLRRAKQHRILLVAGILVFSITCFVLISRPASFRVDVTPWDDGFNSSEVYYLSTSDRDPDNVVRLGYFGDNGQSGMVFTATIKVGVLYPFLMGDPFRYQLRPGVEWVASFDGEAVGFLLYSPSGPNGFPVVVSDHGVKACTNPDVPVFQEPLQPITGDLIVGVISELRTSDEPTETRYRIILFDMSTCSEVTTIYEQPQGGISWYAVSLDGWLAIGSAHQTTVVDLNGEVIARFPETARAYWSRDGEHLALQNTVDGPIVVASRDGTLQTTVLAGDADTLQMLRGWSYDKERLLLQTVDLSGSQAILQATRLNIQSGYREVIADNAESPRWYWDVTPEEIETLLDALLE